MLKVNYSASPYSDRFQVRMGFEMPLQKKDLEEKNGFAAAAALLIKVPHYRMPDLKALSARYRGKYSLATIEQFSFGNDTLTATRKIAKRWKKNREIVFGRMHYSIVYNKKQKVDEIYGPGGELIATIKKWYDVTTADGTGYQRVRISDSEWKYVSRGKDIMTAKIVKNGTLPKIEFIWIEHTDARPLLELLSRIYWVQS